MRRPRTVWLKRLTARVALPVLLAGSFSSTALAEKPADEPCLPAGTLSLKPGKNIKPCPPAKTVDAADGASKRRASAGQRSRRGREQQGPVAYGPAFRMLPDGTSRITVPLSDKVAFQEVKNDNTLTYVLPKTFAPKGNSQRPLMTQFFNTPVSTARLEASKKDTRLVIHLRNAASPTARVTEVPNAKMFFLEIDFPPGTYLTEVPADPKPPKKQGDAPTPEDRPSTTKKTKNPPGPSAP